MSARWAMPVFGIIGEALRLAKEGGHSDIDNISLPWPLFALFFELGDVTAGHLSHLLVPDSNKDAAKQRSGRTPATNTLTAHMQAFAVRAFGELLAGGWNKRQSCFANQKGMGEAMSKPTANSSRPEPLRVGCRKRINRAAEMRGSWLEHAQKQFAKRLMKFAARVTLCQAKNFSILFEDMFHVWPIHNNAGNLPQTSPPLRLHYPGVAHN